jgi:peptide chain release factor subunit 1
LNEFYHRIADHCQKVFVDQFAVKGVIVGGPGPTKENFLKEEYLDYRLQNNIITTLDTSYSGDEGVRELIDKVNEQGVMTEYRLMEEKRIIKRFMSEVYSGKGLGIYGVHDTLPALKNGIVDMLIVTDDISYVVLELKCKRCGKIQEKFIEKSEFQTKRQELLSFRCPSCSSIDFDVSEKDVVDYLEELSTLSGSKLEIISGKTEEGAQLASLGKIGAILRFRQIASA